MRAGHPGNGAPMSISVGDDVSWKTSQGTTHGKAVEKKTKPFQFAKQEFKASEDEPYFIVESDKTGQKAAHKESALKKRS
jgi:plastocyanin